MWGNGVCEKVVDKVVRVRVRRVCVCVERLNRRKTSQCFAGGTEADFLSVPTKLRKSVERELGRQFYPILVPAFYFFDMAKG